jgi:tetratricopeptide (TPR) repeat protein
MILLQQMMQKFPVLEQLTLQLQALLAELTRITPEFPYKKQVLMTLIATAALFLVVMFFRTVSRIIRSLFFTEPNVRGERLIGRGKFAKAKKYFLKAGNYFKLAHCNLRLGEYAEAAKNFEIAKEYDQAAKYYAQEKDYQKAAKIYEMNGRPLDAAEKYELAGEFMSAAEIFKKLRYLKKAEEMFSRVHAYHKVGEMFVHEHNLELNKAIEKIDAKSQEKRQVYLRDLTKKGGDYYILAEDFNKAASSYLLGGHKQLAAEAYEKNGNFTEAARLYGMSGMKQEAAGCFEKAGNYQEAISRYQDLEDNESIARVLESCGRLKEAAEYRGILELKRGQKIEAAERFEQAGRFVEAATLQKEAKNFAKAADLYTQSGDFKMAAETHLLANDLVKAAENFQKVKLFREAAKCYHKLRQEEPFILMLIEAQALLEAAGFLEKKDPERAISLLQKIPPTSNDYRAACHLLGRIFMGKQMDSLANEMFERSVKDQEVGKQNLDFFYDLATLRHRQGQLDEAIKILDKILTVDYHFKDALTLRADLGKNLNVTTQPMIPNNAPSTSPQNKELVNNRYQIEREVGRGGMGVVYLAMDLTLQRSVALKFLPNSLSPEKSEIERFLNEARSAARLNHPNIVTIYDIDLDQGNNNYFIAMEFIDGVNLKEIITASHNLPFQVINLIGIQICDALGYAHQKNIVHRDIKTANLIWTNDKVVKITDFGLAKMLEESIGGGSTRSQGSPIYMSPEQVLGQKVDARSDIYSFGISLYEITTGKVPFERGDIGYHHINTPPPAPQTLRPEIPNYLNDVILKSIEKKPENRYQSAQEIKKILQNAISASPEVLR